MFTDHLKWEKSWEGIKAVHDGYEFKITRAGENYWIISVEKIVEGGNKPISYLSGWPTLDYAQKALNFYLAVWAEFGTK